MYGIGEASQFISKNTIGIIAERMLVSPELFQVLKIHVSV
jgi:hypothetical protein